MLNTASFKIIKKYLPLAILCINITFATGLRQDNQTELAEQEWNNIQQQAYIKASNTGNDDRFGHSVAISGNTLVVGAPREDSNATGVNGDESNNSAANTGAVYVFTKTTSGWAQQAYIKASNSNSNDQFGWSVALSGDTLVVGAFGESSNAVGVAGNQSNNTAADSGAVYVFTRTANTWSQQAYIKASNTNAGDEFGAAIDIDGDTLVVGANGESSNAIGVNGNDTNNSAIASGAVYVFTRSTGIWSQQAYIKASNTDSEDLFGWSVAVSENSLVVGAVGESSSATGINGDQTNNLNNNSGAAYAFTRTNNTWSQQAYIKASNSAGEDDFGYSVDISKDALAIGAWGQDRDVNNNIASFAGAGYVFARTSGIWSQQAYLKGSNTDTSDQLGWSVAISGQNLIIGANGEDSNASGINGNGSDNSVNNSGAAYLFNCEAGIWSQQAYIKASNTGFFDDFGFAVAIAGRNMVFGAQREASNAIGVGGNEGNNSASNSGAVYVSSDDLIFANGFENSLCISL